MQAACATVLHFGYNPQGNRSRISMKKCTEMVTSYNGNTDLLL